MAQIERAAVLIGAPNLLGHSYLAGVDSDMKMLRAFLLSPNGGAWRESEIFAFSNPKKSGLLAQMATLAKSKEYLFCAFGGHGQHTKSDDQTSLCLNDQEEIKVSDLFPSIKRQTLLIDSCRRLTAERQLFAMKEAVLASRSHVSPLYSNSCREFYDKEIMSAEEGRVVMYSCSVNQAADDGLFTPAIVACAETWGMQNTPRNATMANHAFLVSEAFELAKATTVAKNSLQIPTMSSVRRLRHFPFAVA